MSDESGILPLQPINLPQAGQSLLDRLKAENAAGSPASALAGVKAAKDFESVLLDNLVEEMKNTIGHSGLLDGPISQQVDNLFWQFLSRDLARQGGLGLWKEIYRQMHLGSCGAAAQPTAGASASPASQGSTSPYDFAASTYRQSTNGDGAKDTAGEIGNQQSAIGNGPANQVGASVEVQR